MPFDRKTYFDCVRQKPFGGSMNQDQVDGQDALLRRWELKPTSDDMRFFAYMLATTFHETAKTMQPIEEYGKGSGKQYGKKDPETGQTYYGRGFVQLTWRDNYARATQKLYLTGGPDDLEWHAARALDLEIAADVMFRGMTEGWFTGKKLGQYFSETKNDPVNARAIINADVSTMGKKVAGYHGSFLAALEQSWSVPAPEPEPEPESETETVVYHVTITKPKGAEITVAVVKSL